MKTRPLLIGILAEAIVFGSLACSQSKQGEVDKVQATAQGFYQRTHSPLATTPEEVLQLRSECAKLGERILAQNASGDTRFTDSQLSHYDPLKKRCYVELTVQKTDSGDPTSYLHKTLWDGQTEALLADYVVEGSGCPVGDQCKRRGVIFGTAKGTARDDNAADDGHDSASATGAFIDNAMVDDGRR